MSNVTTSAPAKGQAAQSTKPASTKKQGGSKAAPKKTTHKPATTEVSATEAAPPVKDAQPGEVSLERAIEITGAVVRPKVEPNAKAPKPVPATPDDIHAIKVAGSQVSVVTVDGQKFAGVIG